MNNTFKVLSRLILLSAAFIAPYASATVIDFEGIPDGDFSFGTEDGYNLSVNSNGWISLWGSGGNGTINFGAQSPDGSAPVLTITKSGGGVFNFESIDLKHFGSSPDSVIQGFLSASLVGQDVYNPTDGGTMATFGASALLGVAVDSLVIMHIPYSHQILLDNIVLSEASVPEPSILVLLSIGLIGLGARRRRIHQTNPV
ncbi:MAG: hypothetical protein COA96_04285 [SAR86 cluster bacterium]|uniref:Ice-binding protein C-terminal domain-containing protein n=1 Tax=SAR86 cluster bacterium TaxID=2030880 RepID=A0A2A5B5T2_9GAMM|nr:MAG: hypothetical protein COA96_04285 [SAR86 cluster bacterium]